MIRYFDPLIWEDIEPESFGPFSIAGVRDSKAGNIMAEHGDSHGIYAMDIEKDKPKVYSLFDGFFEHVGDAL